MNILYDFQAFTIQNYGGISRIFNELNKKFDGIENTSTIYCNYSNNIYSTSIKGCNKFLPNLKFKGKVQLLSSFNKFNFENRINRINYDIFHPTYYDTYFINKIKKKPVVITYHDMINEKLATQFPILGKSTKLIEEKKKLLQYADKIIAVSECTKKDIIELYNISPEKVDVVYNGNSIVNTAGELKKKIVNTDYILFVGKRDLYKNFEGIISILPEYLDKYNLELVCAGGGEFTKSELLLMERYKIKNRVKLISKINDILLYNLYSNALFFIFPSLYEGFGLPVIESFASSCPALLSNCGSLPEVGFDSAYYFDPYDTQSIHEGLSLLINDEEFRKKLIIKGRERAKLFTWDQTYENTINVYKSLLK
jgi:glycosyltransferase involved in cell wall biosynthesis